jgi:hypothetical protein
VGVRKLASSYLLFFGILVAIAQTFGSVTQDSSSTPQMVEFDLMNMSDAPIRFQVAFTISAILLAALMVSVFFRRIRFRWIEIPARILTGIILLYSALQAMYILRHGIGWPNDGTKTGMPPWVFSRPADLCFLIAWLSVVLLAILLIDRFARKILPNPRVHPAGAKGRSAPGG